jgi:hypothetical protein
MKSWPVVLVFVAWLAGLLALAIACSEPQEPETVLIPVGEVDQGQYDDQQSSGGCGGDSESMILYRLARPAAEEPAPSPDDEGDLVAVGDCSGDGEGELDVDGETAERCPDQDAPIEREAP